MVFRFTLCTPVRRNRFWNVEAMSYTCMPWDAAANCFSSLRRPRGEETTAPSSIQKVLAGPPGRRLSFKYILVSLLLKIRKCVATRGPSHWHIILRRVSLPN